MLWVLNMKKTFSSSLTLFPGGTVVKNLPTSAREARGRVQSLSQEDPPKEEMATYSSILAWRITWTENLVGYSPWGCKESDTTELTEHTQTDTWPFLNWNIYWDNYRLTCSNKKQYSEAVYPFSVVAFCKTIV